MNWDKEELTKKSKEELIEIIMNFQEEYDKDFFPGIDNYDD